MMKLNRTQIWKIAAVAVGILLLFVLAFSYRIYSSNNSQQAKLNQQTDQKLLKTFTVSSLKEFNGTDPNKPIYMAVEGKVYDVTSGKKFYQTDGDYHYLAGKDSTDDLKPVGTGIITNKYPIIGLVVE